MYHICFLGNEYKCFPNFKQIFLSETVLVNKRTRDNRGEKKQLGTLSSSSSLFLPVGGRRGMVGYGFSEKKYINFPY